MRSVKSSPAQSSIRPFMTRNRGLVFLTIAAATGVGFVVRHRADAMRRNELAQKNSSTPNFYVSVDRSGGGI